MTDAQRDNTQSPQTGNANLGAILKEDGWHPVFILDTGDAYVAVQAFPTSALAVQAGEQWVADHGGKKIATFN